MRFGSIPKEILFKFVMAFFLNRGLKNAEILLMHFCKNYLFKSIQRENRTFAKKKSWFLSFFFIFHTGNWFKLNRKKLKCGRTRFRNVSEINFKHYWRGSSPNKNIIKIKLLFCLKISEFLLHQILFPTLHIFFIVSINVTKS